MDRACQPRGEVYRSSPLRWAPKLDPRGQNPKRLDGWTSIDAVKRRAALETTLDSDDT
jgi:hypothetical protein